MSKESWKGFRCISCKCDLSREDILRNGLCSKCIQKIREESTIPTDQNHLKQCDTTNYKTNKERQRSITRSNSSQQTQIKQVTTSNNKKEESPGILIENEKGESRVYVILKYL